MNIDLRALIRAWEIEASRHDEAAEECDQLSPSDQYEASMHGEAARVYRKCAEALHRLVENAHAD
jgi:hypothetical protein